MSKHNTVSEVTQEKNIRLKMAERIDSLIDHGLLREELTAHDILAVVAQLAELGMQLNTNVMYEAWKDKDPEIAKLILGSTPKLSAGALRFKAAHEAWLKEQAEIEQLKEDKK